jgi:hypothetical protein
MESELFGHARGAFSGAVASVDGKLMAARGGSVFLDEIDDTPLSTQVKLLRVLEDGQVTRLGETDGAARRLPHRRRHQSRPADADRAGPLRPGPLRAAGDRHRPPAAAARAGRGHRGTRAALHRSLLRPRRAARDGNRAVADALDALQSHPWPATSASCAT